MERVWQKRLLVGAHRKSSSFAIPTGQWLGLDIKHKIWFMLTMVQLPKQNSLSKYTHSLQSVSSPLSLASFPSCSCLPSQCSCCSRELGLLDTLFVGSDEMTDHSCCQSSLQTSLKLWFLISISHPIVFSQPVCHGLALFIVKLRH